MCAATVSFRLFFVIFFAANAEETLLDDPVFRISGKPRVGPTTTSDA